MKVLLIVDVQGLNDQERFEKHLKKEGLKAIECEPFAYEGETSTHLFSTRAFLLEVVEKALQKGGGQGCKLMFQVGENPMEAYVFDKLHGGFREASV